MVMEGYVPDPSTIARAGLELARREQFRRNKRIAKNALIVLGAGVIPGAAIDNTHWKPKLIVGATLLTAAYRLHEAR